MSHPALNPRTGALQAVCICKDRYFLDNQTKIRQGMKYEFYTSGLTYGESESSENGECAPESAHCRKNRRNRRRTRSTGASRK